MKKNRFGSPGPDDGVGIEAEAEAGDAPRQRAAGVVAEGEDAG